MSLLVVYYYYYFVRSYNSIFSCVFRLLFLAFLGVRFGPITSHIYSYYYIIYIVIVYFPHYLDDL